MRYEPHGQVDFEDQWINPWFNLIGWLVIILYGIIKVIL